MKQKRAATDRMAEKALDSNAFQASWQIHLRAFGPLLAPAFADNEPARIHLCNALNHISRRNCDRGEKLLTSLDASATTDADCAMVAFAHALACEMRGDGEGAARYYRKTVIYGSDFYLPYAKLARTSHIAADFDAAAGYYRAAIRALLRGEAIEQARAQIASLRVNLASALTMMHDYETAAEVLAEARADLPEQPGREATEAMLAAAMGDAPRVEALIATLSRTLPHAAEETRRMTDEILAGKHPQFSPVAFDPAALDAFWSWCMAKEVTIKVMLKSDDCAAAEALLSERLAVLSPYLMRTTKVIITPTDIDGIPESGWRAGVQDRLTVTLGDYHMVALRTLYEALITCRPAGLLPTLTFCVGH